MAQQETPKDWLGEYTVRELGDAAAAEGMTLASLLARLLD